MEIYKGPQKIRVVQPARVVEHVPRCDALTVKGRIRYQRTNGVFIDAPVDDRVTLPIALIAREAG